MSLRFETVKKYEGQEQLIPERKTAEAAGYDLLTAHAITLQPWKPTLISTGVKCYLPKGTYLQLQLRSSAPLKNSIIMTNSPGIIDRDYVDNEKNEGEIFVQVMNYGKTPLDIPAYTKIAQGICCVYMNNPTENIEVVRKGGFGSTEE